MQSALTLVHRKFAKTDSQAELHLYSESSDKEIIKIIGLKLLCVLDLKYYFLNQNSAGSI